MKPEFIEVNPLMGEQASCIIRRKLELGCGNLML
jgi:hypothetical protein